MPCRVPFPPGTDSQPLLRRSRKKKPSPGLGGASRRSPDKPNNRAGLVSGQGIVLETVPRASLPVGWGPGKTAAEARTELIGVVFCLRPIAGRTSRILSVQHSSAVVVQIALPIHCLSPFRDVLPCLITK